MGYLAKLEWGSRKLDLNDSTFSLGNDFVPPSTDYNLNIASGTSANVNAGGEVVGQKALDRDWSFPVRILGASDAETHLAARKLRAFLSLAHDKTNTLYFCYKPNDDYDFEPLWGQYGSYLRYEIKHADAPIGQQYSQGSSASPIYTKALIVNVNMLIGPHALGQKQRVGSAVGGVLEDWIGTPDGESRGLIVPPATTNLFDNPVFGNSTYDTDYTAGGDLSAVENTDKDFVLFKTSSVKLLRTATGGNGSYYQAITATVDNYIISVYAKKMDGSAVTDSDVKIYYGDPKTSTYTNEGNGWYRVSWSGTCAAAPAATGVVMQGLGTTVYIDGFQMEQKTVITPLCYGDMLGCSWSGTPHAAGSTSSRTQGRVRIEDDDVWNNAEGTIIVVMKMHAVNTIFSVNKYIFSMDLPNDVILYYNVASVDWTFSDGTNVATSTGEGAFSYGDILIFHCTYDGANGLVLYKNGSSIATNITYTPQASFNHMYIGTTTTPDNPLPGTILGFMTCKRAMTAAEVLADANNITEWANGGDGLGQRVSEIPWLWTKDGDDVVDNCDDTNRDNYCVINGVGGNTNAETELYLMLDSGTANFNSDQAIYLSNIILNNNEFIYANNSDNPGDDAFWYEKAGNADVTCSNGDYDDKSVPAAGTTHASANPEGNGLKALAGKNIYLLMRAQDTDTGLHAKAVIWNYNFSAVVIEQDSYQSLAADTTWRTFIIGPISVPDLDSIYYEYGDKNQMYIGYKLKRDSGTHDMWMDYVLILPEPLIKLQQITSAGTNAHLHYKNRNVVFDRAVKGSAVTFDHIGKTIGKPIEFVPSKYNMLQTIRGDHGVANVITRTTKFKEVYITPRWAML